MFERPPRANGSSASRMRPAKSPTSLRRLSASKRSDGCCEHVEVGLDRGDISRELVVGHIELPNREDHLGAVWGSTNSCTQPRRPGRYHASVSCAMVTGPSAKCGTLESRARADRAELTPRRFTHVPHSHSLPAADPARRAEVLAVAQGSQGHHRPHRTDDRSALSRATFDGLPARTATRRRGRRRLHRRCCPCRRRTTGRPRTATGRRG